MSVALRQLQKAKEFFLIIKRDSLSGVRAVLQLIFILFNDGFAADFLKVSVYELRRAEVPTFILENIFNALLESRKFGAGMGKNSYRD